MDDNDGLKEFQKTKQNRRELGSGCDSGSRFKERGSSPEDSGF